MVAFKANKLLPAVSNQAHRHGIEQFVGKMHARKWLQRLEPLNLLAKYFQHSTLPLLQNCKRLDYPVAQCCEEFRRAFLQEFEHIAGEPAIMCALFQNHEIVGFAQTFPNLDELRGQQLTEKRADAHVRKIVAIATNRAATGGVISMLRVIQRLLHEPGE